MFRRQAQRLHRTRTDREGTNRSLTNRSTNRTRAPTAEHHARHETRARLTGPLGFATPKMKRTQREPG
jgi:hypothetical protein